MDGHREENGMTYFVKVSGQVLQVESAQLTRCLSDDRNTQFDGSVCRVTAFLDIDLEEAVPGDGGVFDFVDGKCAFGDIAAQIVEADGTIVLVLEEDATLLG